MYIEGYYNPLSGVFAGMGYGLFDGNKEYLVKHFKINVPSESEKETATDDWNVVCYGVLSFDKETSTAIINEK